MGFLKVIRVRTSTKVLDLKFRAVLTENGARRITLDG
jgi:hypothetical protein